MSLPVASPWKISFLAEEEINKDMENIWIFCSLNGRSRVDAKFPPSFFKLKKLGKFCVFTPQLYISKMVGHCRGLVQGELRSLRRNLCAWVCPGWLGQTFLARMLCVLTSCFCTGKALPDGFPHPGAPALRAAFCQAPWPASLARACKNSLKTHREHFRALVLRGLCHRNLQDEMRYYFMHMPRPLLVTGLNLIIRWWYQPYRSKSRSLLDLVKIVFETFGLGDSRETVISNSVSSRLNIIHPSVASLCTSMLEF